MDIYHRAPDLSILIANTDKGEDITKDEFKKAIYPWLSEAEIAEDAIEVEGPDLGSRFVVSLKCAGTLAARRLRAAHTLLKDKDKKWRKIFAPAAANENKEVQIYFNFDESPRDRRQNGSARAAARLVRLALPNQKVFCRGNIIQVGRDELARCTAKTPEEDTKIQFYPKAVAKFGLDSEDIKKKFLEGGLRSVAEEDWV